MNCIPELTVSKRKSVSGTKMARRLRRFVRDNQPRDVLDANDEPSREVDAAAKSPELVCRIPEETLFQLQQIYEALEAKGSRRRMTLSGVPMLTPSTTSNDADQSVEPSADTPPSKKRSRAREDPASAGGERQDDRSAKRKKKARRKSAST